MGKVVNMPNTKQVNFGGLDLQLRLDGRSILAIEKRLDKSLMSLFLSDRGGMKMPPTNELLIVMQGANQTHGIKDADIIKAFEAFLDEGNGPMKLQEIVMELLDESGFFGEKESKTDTESEEEAVSLDSNPMDQTEL